jgi:hypothetical protein
MAAAVQPSVVASVVMLKNTAQQKIMVHPNRVAQTEI